MSRAQKIGRVLLVTLSLVVSCILAAMLAALTIFVVERGREMLRSTPELRHGFAIVLASICVNTICVYVLLRIRKADRRLLSDQSQS